MKSEREAGASLCSRRFPVVALCRRIESPAVRDSELVTRSFLAFPPTLFDWFEDEK
jgi:hypothetical protein